MSYEYQVKQELKQKIKRSKARSQSMERTIAKALNGTRVPMSGAGMFKGDGVVNHPKLGMYLIECKTSEYVHRTKGSGIRVVDRWFDKLEQDRVAMKATFAMFVFHWHRKPLYYVAIPEYVKSKLVLPNVNHVLKEMTNASYLLYYDELAKELPCIKRGKHVYYVYEFKSVLPSIKHIINEAEED